MFEARLDDAALALEADRSAELALSSQPFGNAARAVAALFDFAAIGVEDAVVGECVGATRG